MTGGNVEFQTTFFSLSKISSLVGGTILDKWLKNVIKQPFTHIKVLKKKKMLLSLENRILYSDTLFCSGSYYLDVIGFFYSKTCNEFI